ncbi:hypothetical protein DFR70_1011024 [Nocardia tenerifensis]|uniref:Uncharacterized protein n=1 Tax=Nocardia tenerifensis TaxID=228006 RepID=A0A318KPK8_9NOCA|nr:hypothetical protein [Nocardia tenerifensis]PXX71590.1 hypothetical protein DFR70_1011024 [Nocardia tenerifensis]
MKDVLRHIDSEALRLSRHALFTGWLDNDAIPLREKFVFTPMALDFIMGFRDFNMYFVRYPEPRNELEASLNAHSREDETHSALLLRDWASLELDKVFDWAPRDLYWWLTCDETVSSRRADFELTSLVYHNPDPLFRFALIESMEAAGEVFFTRTVPIAEALGPDESFPYFGRYHLERETGHLQDGDERPFRTTTLTPAQRDKAIALATRVFEIFHFHFTTWADFAHAVHDKRWTFDARSQGRAAAVLRPDRPRDVTRFLALEHPSRPTTQAEPLNALCQKAFDALWQTPAYHWMREAWPGDFRRMTRYFLLQWVVDNWACADYFRFDTAYARPESPVERGINRLSTLYASEMNCRYTEWETLRLDEYTNWSPSEALRHFWLDERVAEHRAIFADLRKLTFRYPEPRYRYWIMKCFIRFGDPMIHSLGTAMRRAGEADEAFIMFAGRPERMHPDLPPDPEADEAIANLEQQPLTPENIRTIQEIIAETHRQEARRSAVTWQIIREERYAPFDRRWTARHRPN